LARRHERKCNAFYFLRVEPAAPGSGVELVVDGGETVAAELSRDEADGLPLAPGAPVYVRPRRERRFTEADVEATV